MEYKIEVKTYAVQFTIPNARKAADLIAEYRGYLVNYMEDGDKCVVELYDVTDDDARIIADFKTDLSNLGYREAR